MPVAAVGAGDPAGQAVPGDLGDAGRGEVEDDDVGRRRARQRATRTPVSIFPPLSRSTAASASAIDCEPPRRDRPAEAVAGADQRHADRGAHRPRQRAERVGGDAAEQRPGLRRLPGAREQRRRARRRAGRSGPAGAGARAGGPTAGRCPRAAPSKRARRPPNTRRQASPSSPSPCGGLLDRAQHHPRAAVVERVGAVDLGPAPLQPVAPRARATGGTAIRRPSGGRPSRGRGRRPGTVSSPLRVPPPIVSSASSTVTATPSRASATAQASPLGPEPTTTPRSRCGRGRHRRAGSAAPGRP